MNSNPLDDFRVLFDNLPQVDDFNDILFEKKIQNIRTTKNYLNKHSLGELEKFLKFLYKFEKAEIINPTLAIYASTTKADNDIEKSKKLIKDLSSNETLTSQFCKNNKINLKIYDLALDLPTSDPTEGPAFTDRNFAATMAFGMESIAGGVDLLSVSSANDEANSIILILLACILLNIKFNKNFIPTDTKKQDKINKMIEKYGNTYDVLDLLKNIANREIAAMFGAILAARIEKIPVVISGYTSILVALALKKIKSNAVDHCIIAQLPRADFAKKINSILKLPILLNFNSEGDIGFFGAISLNILQSSYNGLKSIIDI